MKVIAALAMAVFATSAQAEIRSVPKTITHTTSNSEFKDVEVKAEIWDVEEKMVQELASWREFQCDFIPADDDGEWYGFYELPLADKPAALYKAVRGFASLDEARKVVYASQGFFAVRPRHWNAFKQEIANAEEALGLYGLYWNAVYTYGDSNARNLGYARSSFGLRTPVGGDAETGLAAVQDGDFNNGGGNSGGGSSGGGSGDFNNGGSNPPDGSGDFNNGGGNSGGGSGDFNNGGGSGDFNNPPPPAQSYDCRYVDKYALVWRLKKVERKIDTLTKRIDISFEGGVLLSGESEYVTLRWDGKSETVAIDSSNTINRYGINSDSRGNVYRLKSEGRKAIRPNTADFTYSFSTAGGKLVVKVSDSRSEELTRLSEGKYGVNVSFKVVKKGGMCGSNKVVATVTNSALTSAGEFDVTSSLSEAAATGDKFRVEDVVVERTGTTFFSGSVTLGSSDFYKY